MPSLKQKIAFKEITENHGNASAAMRKAGYSENTIKKPTNLTESKGFIELMEAYLPDEELVRVHEEGLKAVKKIFKNNIETGKVEEVSVEPDYQTRHRYLETAYKIKGRYKENAIEPEIKIQLINYQQDSEPESTT
ncbi:MAG: hypothetical protein EXS52_01225 [Candidatus Staskawiczbacteria bacterium]|nr:hypothetical protein [Candidatus Staskawiczbacteria bacterium]